MDKIIVLKCGGSVIEKLAECFYSNIQALQNDGYKVVIVHGGGPDITNTLKAMNIPTEFYHGQRKTTQAVLEVAEMVLSGKINKKLVNNLQENGINAVGLSGKDGNLLTADFLDKKTMGYVGKVTKIETEIIKTLVDKNYLPVIAPLGKTSDYQTLNINADVAAGAIASALNAEKLLFVTDVPGILNEEKLIAETTPEEIEQFIESGVIHGGMIPKVKTAVASLSEKLEEVMIVTGEKSFLDEKKFIGTKVFRKKEAVL
ncbi:acetylglutamate kinase [Metabacillus arenae]|uniref:Acetylglutamate kinase n=1 Tax=Metabacillus arenae TaxID=2771434 RepID=A0A926RYY0_9BACI|nr:acetylglutamate kinase [Metabacillus arenae]MBD1383448.1 acetylglutamate kinase [Metabacillus arenae]